MTETAAAVVVGSGAFGAATACHLARRGVDVVLVDQHALGSQTSPRAAGLTSQAASLPVMARLRREACEAFERFEADTGRSAGFHRSGSLKAAYTEAGEARHPGGPRDRPGPRHRDPDRVGRTRPAGSRPTSSPVRRGSIGHVPSDGWLDPATVAVGLAARAGALGARLRPFTRVTGLLRDGARVAGVATAAGEIRAPVVVDAAGAWTRSVAAAAGIRLPLVTVRHQLYVTEPIPGVLPLQPIVRLIEASVYVRYAEGGLMFGGYEDAPQVVDPATLPPGFQVAQLGLDLGVLRALTDEVVDRFPPLRGARIALHRGGLPTMTPDGNPILGPVPGLDGLYVASGCCVGGLSLSPAAGRTLADLIVDGRSDPDLEPVSVERFRRWGAADDESLRDVCVEHYARKYMK